MDRRQPSRLFKFFICPCALLSLTGWFEFLQLIRPAIAARFTVFLDAEVFPFNFSPVLSFGMAAQYRFESWTTENGLPQTSVRAMRQTSDGSLWLSTLDGLARFDGVRFTVFNKSNSKNLPGNRFINLFAESDHTLWICTEDQGLIRYRAGEFQNFTTKDGLPSDFIYEISKDSDGNTPAFTRKGSARFEMVQ